MSRYEHGSVLGLLRQGEELLTECVRCLARSSHKMINPQSTQNREKLVRIIQGLTEVLRTRVGLLHFNSTLTFRGKQRCAQSDQYVYFALETLRGLGERCK
jgi:hypothetical protein